MVVTDPVADFLIRIKNGYLARKKMVVIPWSKIKENLATLLVKEGYLKDSKIKRSKDSKIQILEVELKYEDKKPALIGVRRISKPGVRIYAKTKNIPLIRRGQGGLTILSTSQGLMTHEEAKKKNQGGEIICQIW